jgi:hypothetical protein
MAAGVRYRYKGHFISAAKAARLGNLKNAKQYITSEYTTKGKADVIRKGYAPSIEKALEKALKADRAKADARAKETAYGKFQRESLERKKKLTEKADRARAISKARKAVKYAEKHDVGIDEAFDSLGFTSSDFESGIDYEGVAGIASDILEYGDEIFDFDLADLEDDDKYKGKN